MRPCAAHVALSVSPGHVDSRHREGAGDFAQHGTQVPAWRGAGCCAAARATADVHVEHAAQVLCSARLCARGPCPRLGTRRPEATLETFDAELASSPKVRSDVSFDAPGVCSQLLRECP